MLGGVNVSKSEPSPDATARPQHRRLLLWLAVVLIVLTGLLSFVAWMPLRNARAAWRAGRSGEAAAVAMSGSRFRIWPGAYRQMIAVALLTAGKTAEGRAYLERQGAGRVWLSAVSKPEVAKALFARGLYEEFLLYDEVFQSPRGDDSENRLFRAAAQTAMMRLPEAQRTLAGIEPGRVDAPRLAALRAALEERKRGSYPYAVDREGKAIATYRHAADDVVVVNPDFAPIIEREAGDLTFDSMRERIGRYDTLLTTLDSRVQLAAVRALAAYRGSLVAIDPQSNDILAIASSRGRGLAPNLALEAQYEPGSVVKTLTILSALSNGVDLKAMFPYRCTGQIKIDGRDFGDWVPKGHGELPNLEEALAQSCNLFFAEVGLKLGREKLRATMTAAGYDGQTDLGLFQAPLGRTVGRIFNNYETAYYAIGLEHASTNALHTAMLASMLANRGVLTTPRLFRGRRNILGEVSAAAEPKGRARIATLEQAETIVRAMEAVVNRPKGTGRRASVDGVRIALKTGTAGRRDRGYHALILGFVPVQSPRMAFGIVVEGEGSSEYVAAKIAHDFVAAIIP